jgi:hypothetical protein
MRIRPTLAVAGVMALLGSPLAHAFTMENNQADQPKFDLEDQMKQFRTGQATGSTGSSSSLYQTPFGSGTLHFGVQQGQGAYSSFSGPRVTRDDFNRVVTPENMR